MCDLTVSKLAWDEESVGFGASPHSVITEPRLLTTLLSTTELW